MLATRATLLLSLCALAAPAIADHENPDADPALERVTIPAAGSPLAFAPGGRPLGPIYARGSGADFFFTGEIPEGDAPSGVVYTPDGSTIIIAHRESRNLILWDASTLAFIGEAPVSGAAQDVDVTPDGSTAVVACVDTGSVSIVDLKTLNEVDVVPVGQAPGMIKVSPAGDVAAVGNAFDSTISVIDIATGSVLRTIANVGFSQTISFSPEPPASSLQYSEFFFIDDDRVLNVDPFAAEAQFVNVRTGAVHRVTITPNANDVAVSQDGTTAAINHGFGQMKITVLDLATESVSSIVPTTFDMFGSIALNATGTKAAVVLLNEVRVVDLTTGVAGPVLNTSGLNDLLTTSDGNRVLGVGYSGAIIDLATGFLLNLPNQIVSCQIGAVSPVSAQGTLCSTTFGDDMVVINTGGPNGSLTAFQLSGPTPEGDRCRTGAMSPDGSVAVGISILSDTLTIIDPPTRAVTGFAPLGFRPSGVAVTPDGSTAVVANLDSSFATVVDLATASSTNVFISTRGSQVEISPDGQYAYVPVVASGDGVWRINLSTNTVDGAKLLTGNMGGVGYSYSQSSGIDLSPNGSLLAVAGSFDDVVTFIDTASWTVINNVVTNDFPTWIAFSPDSQTCYAAVKNTDQIAVIDVSGATPTLVRHINVGDQPWQMADLGDGRLLVNNWAANTIGVVDLGLGLQTATIPLGEYCTGLFADPAHGVAYAATGDSNTTLGGAMGWSHSESGRLHVIDLSTLTITDTIELGYAPSAMDFDASGSRAILPAPEGDGAVIVGVGGGCNEADLAEPFGSLDFSDVLAFLTAFGAMDPAADLAPPMGVFDFSDVLAFLTAFGGGCP
ncbi:MAG: GC-type dockerin domain-anchored protein [Phycisphaerales bacterium]